MLLQIVGLMLFAFACAAIADYLIYERKQS